MCVNNLAGNLGQIRHITFISLAIYNSCHGNQVYWLPESKKINAAYKMC